MKKMKRNPTLSALLLVGVAVWTSTFALPEQGATAQTDDANMLFSMEEEKMARDVYTALGAKWGQRPFGNIARAEQQHMDSVRSLMAQKGLDLPEVGRAGEFKNAELQKLYNELMKQGMASRTEALKVGAKIEDRDIFDLDRILKETKEPNAKRVYENLRAGSYNHMRAFVRNLQRSGANYKPQYITQARFDAILKGDSGPTQSEGPLLLGAQISDLR
jgi:hypothetical protein